MKALVGYTGFVGSNLYASGEFDAGFNSKNIQEAFGLEPELLVYAGLRAEKYLANRFPQKDLALIEEAERNLERIRPEKLVLISTVDVYPDPVEVDEDTLIRPEGLSPYGADRFLLEEWVRGNFPEALIVRLPGLFGKNLKKNFLYDYLHRIPFMLKEEKFQEFSAAFPELKAFYKRLDNGFYQCRKLDTEEEERVKEIFRKLDFSALNFTDSRSVFQFYPLNRLWSDIGMAMAKGIRLWNPATEPVSAAEVYQFLTGRTFINELSTEPAYYDYRTKHAECFGGKGGYIMTKEQVLGEILTFVTEEEGRKG